MTDHKRKLRPLIITMGGPRKAHMEELFAKMSEDFEPPIFSVGVPSRSLRGRWEFFQAAHSAGLLPTDEWNAIREAQENPLYQEHPERFFECLKDIPVVTSENRRGSQYDVELHYSVELWRKAKTVNRGRAVLGCTLAHLIALQKLTSQGFDFILEDNVRAAPTQETALRIREMIQASREQEVATGDPCHMRYYGWLGSIPNLHWVFESHKRRQAFQRSTTDTEHPEYTTFPFPMTQDIERDLELAAEETMKPEGEHTDDAKTANRKPGGSAPVFGAYAYWMSKDGFERTLETLRTDVGALLWKSKRARYYTVKPIDKILPRQIMASFGQSSVQLSSHPTFFRAPMLTSKIHSQWDPEFCKSTEIQLGYSCLDWSDLWMGLTDTEKSIVAHRQRRGEWLTISLLKEQQSTESINQSKE